jgi:hypothetical protein
MQVTYSDSARQPEERYTLLRRATERLDDVLGPSSGQVTAAWDRVTDEKGRELYRLSIDDFTDKATVTFAPQELESPTHVRVRLHQLWGKLLQDRNQRQLQQLTGSGN